MGADASSAAGLVMELKWMSPPPELRLTARDGTPPLRHQAETRVAQNVRHYLALLSAEPLVHIVKLKVVDIRITSNVFVIVILRVL